MFLKEHGTPSTVSTKDLTSNPFLYGGQEIITEIAWFEQIVDRETAIFKFGGGGYEHYVNALPTNDEALSRPLMQDRTHGAFFLAKVIGTRDLNIMGRTFAVPDIEYVDSYLCAENDCRHLTKWLEAYREANSGG